MPSPPVSAEPAVLPDPGRPRARTALVLLSAASGAADAFVFLCLGQVFAGVMTGNLVLLGASAAGAGESGTAPRVVAALVSYGCGVAGAAWVGGRTAGRLPVMLLTEVALLSAGAVLWACGLVASEADRLGLLVAMGLAMGIQARIRDTPTNYFTGTLTSLVGRLARGTRRHGDGWVLARLAAVVAGAGGAALTVRLWPAGGASAAAVLAAAAVLVEAAGRSGVRAEGDR
ncbi:DUF1275 family protein [Streptomyces sp. NPDC057682]|uniref:DUF1275 family protein n=1 Tax=unclassified Streptomyces TaxID=2593676 RepID=UPI003649FF58